MRKLFYILSFFYLRYGVQAQTHLFSNDRVSDVMPSYECYNIHQDKRGYIWFGTEGGLCRYNGESIKLYAEKKGFKEKSCYGICESQNGTLWFISSKNKVLFYDEKGDSICEADFSKTLIKQLNYPLTDQFYLLQSIGDSTLIFCTQGNTFKVNVITNAIEKAVTEENDAYCFKRGFHSFYPEKSGIDNIVFNEIKLEILGINPLTTKIKWDSKKSPQWRCNTAINTKGDSYIGWDNKLIKINSENKIDIYTTNYNILSVYVDKNNGLWIGTLKGGVLYFENGELNKPIESLNGISVTGICEDHEKGIWCSTLEHGVYYCKDKRIITYSNLYGRDKIETLLKKVDTTIFCYANNRELIGISNKLISINLFELSGGYGLSDIVGYNKGYLVSSLQSVAFTDTKFKSIKYLKSKEKQLIGASDISPSPDGRVFLLQKRLLYEMREDGILECKIKGLASPSECILSREKEIWLGCKDGLYKVDRNTFLQEKLAGINSRVWDIIEMDTDKLWIATDDEGMNILDKGLLRNITPSKLSRKVRFFDLHNDGKGFVWAATNIGLMRINANDPNNFRVFSTEQGLPSNQVTRLTANGSKVYFATGEGLCSFSINEDLTDTTLHEIHLSQLIVDGIDQISTNNISLPYNCKSITAEFDVLTFKQTGKEVLSFDLKNDNQKTYKQGRLNGTKIIFENLPPGSYELNVYPFKKEATHSAKGIKLFFVINKAFWQTWWFFVICVLAFLLIVYLVVKIIITKIKRKEEEKTKINKMIAEYQLSALQAQMNPHFIFNAINSIQGYILEKNEQLAYNYLAKFSKLIRMVLNHSQEKLLPLKQELEMIELYVELEQLRFDKSFDFKLRIDEGVNVFETQVPTMLIQPYIENAIWHGLMNLNGDVTGVLSLDIRLNGDGLKIAIEDNGIGRTLAKTFAKKENHRSVGMKLTEERLAMINVLQNYENAKVLVSDLHDENGKACGTRVEIFIPLL